MKELKRRLVKEVAKKISELPNDKQNYVLGIMDGMLISYDDSRIRKESKKNNQEQEA